MERAMTGHSLRTQRLRANSVTEEMDSKLTGGVGLRHDYETTELSTIYMVGNQAEWRIYVDLALINASYVTQ